MLLARQAFLKLFATHLLVLSLKLQLLLIQLRICLFALRLDLQLLLLQLHQWVRLTRSADLRRHRLRLLHALGNKLSHHRLILHLLLIRIHRTHLLHLSHSLLFRRYLYMLHDVLLHSNSNGRHTTHHRTRTKYQM